MVWKVVKSVVLVLVLVAAVPFGTALVVYGVAPQIAGVLPNLGTFLVGVVLLLVGLVAWYQEGKKFERGNKG